MPSAVSSLGSGRSFEPSIAATSRLGADGGETLELQQLVDRERVDVGRVADTSFGIAELEHRALAETLDVHRAAGGEVDDALIALERARRLDTARCWLRLRAAPASDCSGHGQRGGEHPRFAASGPHRQHGPDDFGDDIAGLAHDDGVAGAHVFQRAPDPGCAAWPCRRSNHRRTPARAPRTAWPDRCDRSTP